MSVFYKFKSALTYDTIQFDDLHISLQEFKKAVVQQKQLGKNTNFDLQVTNAETNEVYNDQNNLIPKNSSLVVVRVPLSGTQKKWDIGDQLSSKIGVLSSDYLQENAGNIVVKSADLATLNASEGDKIQAMMFQSTVDYDPANYQKIKGGGQYGDPPANYICHKCRSGGHWIKDCPITVVPDIKKSSGIPQSFMTPVDPSAPGAYMTPSGKFAVPIIDMQAYKEGKKEKPFIPSEETEQSLKTIIPEELTCSLCHDLMSDVVMMPCCGTSFCDECIRNHLIDSDDNQCPDCKEKDVSPDTLIPNRFLRNKVNNFRNQTGYVDVRRNDIGQAKTQTIDNDQDVQIVEPSPEEVLSTVATTTTSSPVRSVTTEDIVKEDIPAKYDTTKDDDEKGSAIVVLGSATRAGHMQQRAAPIVQRNLVGKNINLSPDDRESDRRKSSPGLTPVSHVPPPTKKFSGPPKVPNTTQPPPGYNQQTIQPIRPHHYAGNSGSQAGVPPVHYGPPPGVNPMGMPPHMASQPQGRMYPYGPPPNYPPHMRGGFRGSMHPNMHSHMNEGYSSRNNVVEDPEAAFESYLRERERQDRMKRNRGRRSRSRSGGRWKSQSRSRSRSSSKKRSPRSPPSPSMRKESPFMRNSSRTPPGIMRRSESRGRTRLRSRSPRGSSRSPFMNDKKKRSRSMTPPSMNYKKDARSPSPVPKKLRARSRTRSPPARMRKRRRTRSRTMSRSISRGRSFSGSVSPRRRPAFSPNYVQRRRRTPSPPRHAPPPSRSRGGHYRDHSPYHSSRYHESNDRYKRNPRNARYPRGSRFSHSHHNYETNSRYERHGSKERYEEKRYVELKNGRDYSTRDEPTKSRSERSYSPAINTYERQYSTYEEVAPPGTTDLPPAFGYPPDIAYLDNRDERRGDYDQVTPSQSNFRDMNTARDEYKKSKDHHERRRSRSRERRDHHHHHGEPEKNKQHGSGQTHSSYAKDPSAETEKLQKDIEDRKEESRAEKRDKSKRKKKKESDVEKKRKDSDADRKKKKKLKQAKKDDSKTDKTSVDLKSIDDNKMLENFTITRTVSTIENKGDIVELRVGNDDIDVQEQHSKHEPAILASVPELSKWEREELSSSADEQRALISKSDSSDKKTVTDEILKHAEKVLFQKNVGLSASKSSRNFENKNELPSLKDELVIVETTREARKSGNSIQVTVPAAPNKSEDENKPIGRISAKHRLGAKVEDKNFSSVRSLVEAKQKPRSTVKAVVDAKSKSDKHEKRERHHEKHRDESKKARKEKKKEDNDQRSEEKNISKSRDSKETNKEKNQKSIAAGTENVEEAVETKSTNNDVEVAAFDKKQPVIDEANFEPDYDLTESEGEIRDDEPPIVVVKKTIDNMPEASVLKEVKQATEKPIPKADVNAEDISSSESDSISSSDSSNDRKKRKKRAKKKKKKVKKRRVQSSSDSDSEESSDSESESDSKHKHKKKHRHKTKKSSKSTKKKKKSKYR